MADANWRDSARPARFLGIDYRAVMPLVLFLLHIRLWTFVVAILATVFFALLERYGFSVPVFGRLVITTLGGARKMAVPWWKQPKDYN